MAAYICYFTLAFVILESTLLDRSAAVQLCPSSCYCLGNNVDCSKQGLISVPKDLPTWVTRLELQNNGITALTEEDFRGFTNLSILDLSNNQIRKLNESVFRHLPNLETLKINRNSLVDVPKFQGLPNLKILEVNHNSIHSLAVEFLAYMPHLQVLELNHNALTDIMPGTFPANNSLQKLILNNNNLESFEQGCLDNLTSLQVLKMNKNKINTISKHLFNKLTKLVTVEITKNRLSEIEGLTFQKLSELKVLKLRKNTISVIKDGAFWGLDSLKILQLEHNNISKVSQRWLYGLNNLEEIYLGHNHISAIDPEAWEFCQNLLQIDLSNNKLVTLTGNSFINPTHLRKLYLNNNHILNIQDGVFRELGELEELDLSNNEISWTIEDKNGVFRGLQNLEELRLESNKIQSIASNAFDGLPRLRILKLKNNEITSIQNQAFEAMVNLQQLYFNSSAFLCDCHLSWLVQWLLKKSFHNTVVAKCAHPPNIKGRSIFNVDLNLYVCEGDLLKPVITVHPKSQVALRNENITLRCEAVSTEDSPIEITWKKNNLVLVNPNSENKVSIEKSEEGQQMFNYTSYLHLTDVQDSVAGNYQCVIKNDLGSAYSRKANISVHVYPEFDKTPRDVIVKAGTTARLECSASGLPIPVIGWKKDGGDNFPAARERRMHVMPQDDIFFIVDVKQEDEGIYSCTANNSEGLISANATLTVQRVPTFVRKMQSHKYTHEGNTAVLECMADGSPKPKITWLKNGKPLDKNRRYFLAARNQLLIIVQTVRSDMGLYTCEMTNTLGTISDNTELGIMTSTHRIGGSSEVSHDNSGTDESTTTGIIIIAVVCCVVGTSLVWVIIIYQTRKRHEMYSATPTDETTLPGDIPSSGYLGDKDGTFSQAITVLPQNYQQYQEYQMKESGYESSSGRFRAARAAIFPSDVDEEENKQSVPLTMADQHMGNHSPENSVSYPNSETDSLKSSESTSSTHTSGQQTLQTFHPVIKETVQQQSCTDTGQCENCEHCRKVKSDTYRCHSLNRHSSMSPYQNGMMYADMHHGSQPQPPGRRRAASSTDMQLLECVCDSQNDMACPSCRSRLSPLYNPPVRLANNVDPNSCTYHVTPTSVSRPYSSKGAFYPCHSAAVHNTHDSIANSNTPYLTNTENGHHRDSYHANSIHNPLNVKDNKNLKDNMCFYNGHVVSDRSENSYHGNKAGRRHRSVERLPPVIPPKQHKHSHIHANKCSLPSSSLFNGNSPQHL